MGFNLEAFRAAKILRQGATSMDILGRIRVMSLFSGKASEAALVAEQRFKHACIDIYGVGHNTTSRADLNYARDKLLTHTAPGRVAELETAIKELMAKVPGQTIMSSPGNRSF